MRFKHRQLIAVAVLFAVISVTVAYGYGKPLPYPWKDGHSFEIYHVSGVERSYQAGSRITLNVFGRSLSSGIAPDPESGFNVQAYIDNEDISNASLAGANGTWEQGIHGWVVELSVPHESHRNYRLQVGLGCAEYPEQVELGPCSKTYGRAAQVFNTYYFDVD